LTASVSVETRGRGRSTTRQPAARRRRMATDSASCQHEPT